MSDNRHISPVSFLYRTGILKKAVTAADGKEKSAEGMSSFRVSLAKFIGTGCYIGYMPFAQGTWGSLAIPVVYYILPDTFFSNGIAVNAGVAGLGIILYFIGVWASGVCEKLWGHDPGRVVIDEIVGMFTAIAFVPVTGVTVWAGFLFFRVFDILKPPPVRRFERFRGGWGVMNDDVVAGVYANICVRFFLYVMKMW